jgi:phosphoribosylformylglycinamidine synthase
VTNCLNFGSPEDPAVMWQFEQAVTGLADACQKMGTPVTGGNVSFYNQTGATAIHPTPVVGVLGVIEDVHHRTSIGWRQVGDVIFLLGTTRDELAGSEWAHVVHNHLGGTPPQLDLEAERALGEFLVTAAANGLLASAHDISDGGLAQTLTESCLRSGLGADIEIAGDAFVLLWSESASRAVVSAAPERAAEVTAAAQRLGVPCTQIGVVAGLPVLTLDGIFGGQVAVPISELRTVSEATLPALFG